MVSCVSASAISCPFHRSANSSPAIRLCRIGSTCPSVVEQRIDLARSQRCPRSIVPLGHSSTRRSGSFELPGARCAACPDRGSTPSACGLPRCTMRATASVPRNCSNPARASLASRWLRTGRAVDDGFKALLAIPCRRCRSFPPRCFSILVAMASLSLLFPYIERFCASDPSYPDSCPVAGSTVHHEGVLSVVFQRDVHGWFTACSARVHVFLQQHDCFLLVPQDPCRLLVVLDRDSDRAVDSDRTLVGDLGIVDCRPRRSRSPVLLKPCKDCVQSAWAFRWDTPSCPPPRRSRHR